MNHDAIDPTFIGACLIIIRINVLLSIPPFNQGIDRKYQSICTMRMNMVSLLEFVFLLDSRMICLRYRTSKPTTRTISIENKIS